MNLNFGGLFSILRNETAEEKEDRLEIEAKKLEYQAQHAETQAALQKRIASAKKRIATTRETAGGNAPIVDFIQRNKILVGVLALIAVMFIVVKSC